MNKLYLGALALAAFIVPGISHAQMFAYVNTAGEVRSMEAVSAETALVTAPDLHARSGVMLLDSSADQEVVGDDVPGT